MTNDFRFEYYFYKALDEWPISFNCSDLITFHDGKFIVPGLGELEDRLSKVYIGSSNELIMRTIHQFIAVAIHDAAAYLKEININNLRAEFVKAKVFSHLEYILKTGAAGWDGVEDRAYIAKYLAANDPSVSSKRPKHSG